VPMPSKRAWRLQTRRPQGSAANCCCCQSLARRCRLEFLGVRTIHNPPLINPPLIGEQSIVMSVSVFLWSVCVFVCRRSHLRNYTSDLHQCFVHVTYGCGSVLSGSVVMICYVLPVLWMTLYLLISQDCSTSPPTQSAVHTQSWAWLQTVRTNTSCRPTDADARDYFSGA